MKGAGRWLCAWKAFAVSLCAAAACAVSLHGGEAPKVTIKELPGRLRVEIGDDLFAEYIHQGMPKPIIYPIIGPHGIGMTRNFPMKVVEGEAADHPHQRSFWYTHGDVNGVNFWNEGSVAGTIAQEKLLRAAIEGDRAVIATANKWQKPTGELVCSDTRTVAFSAIPGGRVIDFDITIQASAGDVTFRDTKEGTMGIRTHPNLQLRNDPKRGVVSVSGRAVNSEGVQGADIWGKRAKWVDYWGTIEGKVVGIAILDHPGNPCHPTWWHARDYGLIAANPFGVHDFEGKPRGTGDMKIPAGESRTWRYRFIFHEGDAEQAKIASLYAQYAASKPSAAAGKPSAAADSSAGCSGA